MNTSKLKKHIEWEYFYNIPENSFMWVYLSSNCILTEEFIEEFQNKVDWGCIFKYQKLSNSFIKKYKHKIS